MVAPRYFPGGNLTLPLNPDALKSPEQLLQALRALALGLETWKRQVGDVVNTNLAFSGTTSDRPTSTQLTPLPNAGVGFQFFDTTLHSPVFWDGAQWRNGIGTIV